MEGIGISKDGVEINNDKSKEVKDRVDKILNPDSKVPAVKSVDDDNVDQPNASNETPLAQGDLGKSIVKDIDVDEQLDAGLETAIVSAIEEPSNLKSVDGDAEESSLTNETESDLDADNTLVDISDETVMIEPVVTENKTPKTPDFGKINKSPIEVIHAIGDIHGWAPGLISYLIHHKLATIEIDGYPLQTEVGELNTENLNLLFPDPVSILRKSKRNPPSAGLSGQPGFSDVGVNGKGHGSVMARWIADENVALIQVGDIYDRADHSELASEILRQLIIDAPGRVFVLVGNHEQFMLEDDFDNWYFNESRSAWTDGEISPKRGAKNHFRFLPKWDLKSIEERARETFDRYINATQTLFLTQGAVMQKLGWLNDFTHDLSPMLGLGWSGYINATDIIKKLNDSKESIIPGALTALVIGDTLFHHAEPSAHRSEGTQGLKTPLFHVMTKPFGPNNISFKNYVSGNGALKASPDAPLLWSRGSSVGAASGAPAAESHISELAKAWPGLKRIVHGHTPTVTSGDFDSVTGGNSTSVSYLGDSQNRIMERGRANNIRIYNIDEGMSPVYYSGDNGSYDPTRMPVGLRLEKDENSALESLSAINPLINLDPNDNITRDVRELWRWSKGEWRCSASEDWSNLGKRYHAKTVTHGSWRGFIVIPDQNSESLKTLYNRNIAGIQIGKLMIQKLLNDCFSQGSIEIQEPKQAILERVGPIGELLSKGKTKLAWKKYTSLLVLLKPNQKGGFSCIISNSLGADSKVKLAAYNNNKAIKPIELAAENNHIIMNKISSMERVFIGLNDDSINSGIDHWVKVTDPAPTINSPVIGYYSAATKFDKKLQLTEPPHKKPLEIIKAKTETLDSNQPTSGSKKKPRRMGSSQNWEASSVGGSLKHQGSEYKNLENQPKSTWGNKPKTLDQQKTNTDIPIKGKNLSAPQLNQQGSGKHLVDKELNDNLPPRQPDSKTEKATLDKQGTKTNSVIKEAKTLNNPNKPSLEISNPNPEAFQNSNQNLKSSQTKKQPSNNKPRNLHKVFQHGRSKNLRISIIQKEKDKKLDFSHIEFRLDSVTETDATIRVIINRAEKELAELTVNWKIYEERIIGNPMGTSSHFNLKHFAKWRQKHLTNYIYSMIERLIEEGED